MANNLESNITRKLAEKFLPHFESARVLSKTVNTQLLDNKFNPKSGDKTDFKKPHRFNAVRTPTGDISGAAINGINSGKVTGEVQDYITVPIEWTAHEESLELDRLDDIVAPAASEVVTQIEAMIGKFMLENAALRYGAVGTTADAWSDIAGTGALMDSIGVPASKERFVVMNPYSNLALANAQGQLTGGSDSLVNKAWEESMIAKKFGNMSALVSNALPVRTSSDASDRAGTLAANPLVTYLAHKDGQQQSLSVAGLSANAVVKAGDVVRITGRHLINHNTRAVILNATGARIEWSGTVVADVTLSGTGTGVLVVSGPAIYEASGAYNTVDSAPVSGDVITIEGAASAIYQPNLFYTKDAFSLGTVKMAKLHNTETVITTAEGFSIKVSKGSSFRENTQEIRFDILPAMAAMDVYQAGQGYGN